MESRLLSVRDAAEVLGVSPAAVRLKIGSGSLPAIKQGRDWWLDERVVRSLARQPAKVGRPLAPEMAWAVLLYASGDPDAANRMLEDQRYRSRLRSWLRDHPLPEHLASLRARARSERFEVHPSELPRLLGKDGVMRSGLSCGGVLGLVGGSGEVDVYAPASAREAIMQEHALEPGDGPVLVRWVSDPIWARLPEHR